MDKNAAYYRKKLCMTQHLEGGSFVETYRSDLQISQNCLNSTFAGNRQAATGIYFLLEQGEFSAFHKIASDEMWHFYEGDPLCIY